MVIKHISFEELELYNQKIPMMKTGNQIYQFSKDGEYQIKDVASFEIDLAFEESVIDWKEILSEKTTQILVIEDQGTWIGGAITVTHSPKVNMLRNNMKNAVLWDIRVHDKQQNKGVGTRLLAESIQFAKKMKCEHLIIETQDNNPKAIDFYLKHNAYLIDVNQHAYDDAPCETQLIFRIDL